MATIGNMAAMQYRMAVADAKYGLQSYGLYNKNSFKTNTAQKSYDELWENITKDLDGYIQQEYEKLYNSVFGTQQEESAEATVNLKQASSEVMLSAENLSSFADSLKYGADEYDTEAAQKYLEDFVSDYNTFIDKVGDSENSSVLEKGVMMVNTAKAYSGSLGRVGISVGSDNKLTFDKEYMPEISATDLKTTFGKWGFSEKAAQRAEQINRVSGSSGLFGYTAASTQAYSYNIGALLSTYV